MTHAIPEPSSTFEVKPMHRQFKEHHAQRRIASACALALLLTQTLPVQAQTAPSQTPLLNRQSFVPTPSVMLTLDDSGSMQYQYLPERTFKVNGYSVSFPIDGKVYLHPLEADKNRFTYRNPQTKTDQAYADSRYVTAALTRLTPSSIVGTQPVLNDKMALTQAQMRSPQVNSLYYNPYIRYLPWQPSDDTPSLTTNDPKKYAWPAADRAPLHPGLLLASGVQPDINPKEVNLKLNSNTDEHSVTWYCNDHADWSECEEDPYGNSRRGYALTSLRYRPALVYILSDNADPGELSNYKEYDLNALPNNIVEWPESKASGRTECAKSTLASGQAVRRCEANQELQNFTNWFVFYRSRLLVAQGKMPEALQSALGNIRLGWGTIHPHLSKQTNRDNVTTETWSRYLPDRDLTTSNTYPSYTVQQGVRMLEQAHLEKFTKWIRGEIYPERRTPTLHAMQSVGDYFKRDDTLSPWQNDMNGQPQTAPPLACRRAFHLLVTDGYYNTEGELNGAQDNMFALVSPPMTLPTNIGNADKQAASDMPANATDEQKRAFIPGTRDSNGKLATQRAFSDEVGEATLADYALRFWLDDLQDDILDKVPPITEKVADNDSETDQLIKEVRSNPATWQHLSQLVVGFGVEGSIKDLSNETLGKLINGSPVSNVDRTPVQWPNESNKIDDLLHAALNSRGAYFSASNPKELQDKLEAALASVEPPPQSEAGVATASYLLQAGNYQYVPEYESAFWSGDLTAYQLDERGEIASSASWRASDLVPEPGLRNIYIGQQVTTNSVTKFKAVPFPYFAGITPETSLDPAINSALDPATQVALSKGLVNHIRGEDLIGDRRFRKRQGKLPDFVNATPLYVKEGMDLGYGAATNLTGYATYSGGPDDIPTSYLKKKAKRTKGLVFMGGNGGMLHAFYADSGVEAFAYIPQAAVSKLPLIAHPRYGRLEQPHQYVVDGPLIESDVYFETDTAWHNLVIGTMGSGGKAMFALDLPTTSLSNQTLTGDIVRWESTDPDMGYITSTPQVGLIGNQWTVIVGNGVNSDNGRAALLMINAETGIVTSLPLPMPQTTDSSTSASPLGLGGVALVKDPSSGQVRTIYAGDTHGRLWRFDVSTSGQVSIGYDSQPLFVTSGSTNASSEPSTAPQPILAAPLIAQHPQNGQVVVFTTGRLLYDSDATSRQTQTAYGIWDRTSATASSSSPPSSEPGSAPTETTGPVSLLPSMSRLQKQSIIRRESIEQAGTGSTAPDGTVTPPQKVSFFELSRNTVDWDQHDGWMLDLAIPAVDGLAENATEFSYPKAPYDPIAFGKSVLITAVQPGANVTSCEKSLPEGYAFLIKALTGLAPSYQSIDTDGDGDIDGNDKPYSGFVRNSSPAKVLTDQKPFDPCLDGSVQDPNGGRLIKDCGSKRIKDRAWRQLLNPPAP